MKTFYEIKQNNSGGFFITDKNICHVLIIEESSEEKALRKAEELGCYWDGCDIGVDCPCCGDRWSRYIDIINLPCSFGLYDESEAELLKERYDIITKKLEKKYGSRDTQLIFNSIDSYAQFLADNYGWTSPDVRIYFLDGTVKEIFKK